MGEILTAASAKLGYDRGGKGVRQVASEAPIIRRPHGVHGETLSGVHRTLKPQGVCRHSQEGLPAGLEGRKMLAGVYRVTVPS